MCKSYKGFGRFSIAVGMIFLTLMLVFGINTTRIAVANLTMSDSASAAADAYRPEVDSTFRLRRNCAAFFLLLGAVDLIFYSKYGEG